MKSQAYEELFVDIASTRGTASDNSVIRPSTRNKNEGISKDRTLLEFNLGQRFFNDACEIGVVK
jgi:hypothetical protein